MGEHHTPTIKLGSEVYATPKGAPRFTGKLISYVDSLRAGRFVVVQDHRGNTHHCNLDEISDAQA